MELDALRPGLKGEVELVVEPDHTARHLGSGGVEVLATPQMILLMEIAGVKAVDPLLPEGYRTVGMHLDVRHMAPTPVGMKVVVTAELLEVDGRRLTFEVQARDAEELVGEGKHQRYIIDVDRFAQGVSDKARRQE
jgi:predicted thioesterase